MLVDSDILIDVLRGHEPAVDWFARQEVLPLVPGFVAMELIQNAPNKERLRKATRLIEPLPRIWPSRADCERALANFEQFHLSDGLGLLDVLIAATAMGCDEPLCTFNAKHYRVLRDLEVVAPYRR